jgi:hypothetical protein
MNRTGHILEILDLGEFGFPVAIHRGVDFELGPVVDVDAFDVPAGEAVAVAQRLADLLWPVQAQAVPGAELLPGVVHDFESADRRAALPPDTVWYTPRLRSRVRR